MCTIEQGIFFGYNMNLYFGPAALHYVINNILSYLIEQCICDNTTSIGPTKSGLISELIYIARHHHTKSSCLWWSIGGQ